MAYQTGNIKYRGSFKSIRNWTIAHDQKIYAGEKGGANRDLIMNHPAFKRTRENITEFKGCGAIVKSIRKGMGILCPEQTDTHFTGRLVALVKMINERDGEGIHGKRAISFSLNKPILKTLMLHEKKKIDFQLKRSITKSHSALRTEATIMVNGLNPDPTFVPASAQYYRVLNHLCVIRDFVYNEKDKVYKPMSPKSYLNAYAYSDYTTINTPLTVALKAAFPAGTVLAETETVMQCVGIEYYIRSGGDRFLPFTSGSTMVCDVF